MLRIRGMDSAFPIVLALVLFGTRLGDAPLWDRDEPRNAGCAREMRARGDWVVPVFNDELRTHKPALLYWLIMAATALFGDNEFAARLPSALLSTGTVALTYGLARRLADARTAWWSAVAIASSLLFTMSSRAATPDAALVFFSTLSISCFVLGWEIDRPHSISLRYAVAAYGAMGFAVLAKGPVGLLLPGAVLWLFVASTDRFPSSAAGSRWIQDWYTIVPRVTRRCLGAMWQMRSMTGLLVVLLVAGPWYSWVGLRTQGTWLAEFLGEHNWQRAVRPMEGHEGFPFFYIVTMLVGMFPWSVLSWPILVDLWGQRRDPDRFPPLLRLAGCWLAVYVLAFSLAGTQLPSYVLPAYPAAAILVGSFVSRWQAGRASSGVRWVPWGFAAMLAVGAVTMAGLKLAAARYVPEDRWIYGVGLAPLLAGFVGLIMCWNGTRPWHGFIVLLAAVAMNLSIFAGAAVRVGSRQEYRTLLAQMATRAPSSTLVAYGNLEPSWVYYAGRPIKFYPSDQLDRLSGFVARLPEVTILVSDAELPVLQEQLGVGMELARAEYFLRDRQLVAYHIAAGMARSDVDPRR